MAYLDLNGVRLHYTDTGAGDVAVVFSHGLLFGSEMLEGQIAHLKAKCRCIAYDRRGQGQSGVSEGECDMDTLTGDAAALIAALGVEGCHLLACRWAGSGLGRLSGRLCRLCLVRHF